MTREELFEMMKGTIIVSCQATPGEPLYDPERSVMPLMARAAKQAGAKMIRTSSVRDIIGIKEETGLPVIGLIKREYPGYSGRITMTMREVDECMEALADIVSIDCTDTPRGDGLTAPEFLKMVRQKYPNIIIMADCATLEEAKAAYDAGADLVGSTMNGYTAATAHCKGDPNYELVEQMVAALPCPVIAEGRVHTPEQAKRMLEIGAWAVVVGGAITRPLEIANRFMAVIQ
ncbi:MAG: N-acetylmannosamine-6-phosphate 2-epimerase [Clostridia bacterium]|nr:N-acetylmannosamine-6-phosphate 2-epimerase [Clostridia bacterium]MBQ9288953.1 N-acetylmannosamine-6-phosphate 2-epimerase [Clostridia bacterium]MBQ9291553.1 N-acetylmannosamine-6-phosphate 2-epimerase [Clostridia bacterium]